MIPAVVPVPGWPGYFASAVGGVYSYRGRVGRRLKPRLNTDGYPAVQVQAPSGKKLVPVHKLVALAFLPAKPSPRHEVRHLDGKKWNSAAANLAWGTARENAADRARHGHTARGERAGRARLTEAQARNVKRLLALGVRQTTIARALGVHVATINHIATGRNWSWL